MARREGPRRRWLGGRDSWRRIAMSGLVAGAALALVAAIVTGLIDGGGGSLDGDSPTPAFVPVSGDPLPTIQPAPTATAPFAPTEPLATEPAPTEPLEPTATAVFEATETLVPEEPTETPPLEPPAE